MKTLCFPVLVAGLLFCHGCGKTETTTISPATNTSKSGNPLTAPVDYLGAVAKQKNAAVKTIDAAGLNQTIQLFYAQEGRFPKDLNELVGPNYLGKLPTPPAGMKFHYDPANGQLKVVPQ